MRNLKILRSTLAFMLAMLMSVSFVTPLGDVAFAEPDESGVVVQAGEPEAKALVVDISNDGTLEVTKKDDADTLYYAIVEEENKTIFDGLTEESTFTEDLDADLFAEAKPTISAAKNGSYLAVVEVAGDDSIVDTSLTEINVYKLLTVSIDAQNKVSVTGADEDVDLYYAVKDANGLKTVKGWANGTAKKTVTDASFTTDVIETVEKKDNDSFVVVVGLSKDVYEHVTEEDGEGNTVDKLDEDGNPVIKTDEDGNPVVKTPGVLVAQGYSAKIAVKDSSDDNNGDNKDETNTNNPGDNKDETNTNNPGDNKDETNKPGDNKDETNNPGDNKDETNTNNPGDNKDETNKPGDNKDETNTNNPGDNKDETNKPGDNKDETNTNNPGDNKDETNKPGDNKDETNTNNPGDENKPGNDTPVVPTAPVLPAVSLASKEVVANSKLSITIGDAATGVTVQYALVNRGSALTVNSWADYKNAIEVSRDGNYDFYYRAVDAKNNLVTTSDKYEVVLDTTAPVFRAPTLTKNASTREMTLTLAVEVDSGTALDYIQYSVNGAGWQNYTAPLKFTNVGEYKVEYMAADKAGNVTKTMTTTVNYSLVSLMTVPTVRMLDESPSDEYIRFRLQNYNTELYDYSYQFVEKGEKIDKSDWEYCSGATVMEIDEEGEWDLYIMVEYDDYSDYAKVATCVIDLTEPEIIRIIQPKSSNKGNFNITVDARDNLSRTLEYSYDGGKNWTSSETKTYTKATTILAGDIMVRDEAGNEAKSGFCGLVQLEGRKTVFTEDAKSSDKNMNKDSNQSTTQTPTQNTNDQNNQTTNQGVTSQPITNQSYYALKNGVAVNTTAAGQGYVNGYSDGTFKPDNSIKRSELATILNRVYDFDNSAGNGKSYMDVPRTHWAYQNISSIQSYNVFATNGQWFNPDMVVSRAELAHAICQFVDTSSVSTSVSNPYSDINGNSYYNDILAVTQLGLMNGVGNNTFSPNTPLTRAQIVTVVNRLISVSSSASQYSRQFSDVPQSHWAYNDIMLASR